MSSKSLTISATPPVPESDLTGFLVIKGDSENFSVTNSMTTQAFGSSPFEIGDIDVGTHYYRVASKDKFFDRKPNLEELNWSDVVVVNVEDDVNQGTDDINPIITKYGRKLYRHPNGFGSVIEYDFFGDTVKLFVADAKFRISKTSNIKYGTYNIDNGTSRIMKTWFFSIDTLSSNVGIVDYQKEAVLPDGIFTDERIQRIYPDLKNIRTAKEDCDILYTYKDTDDNYSPPIHGVPALEYCRSKTDIFPSGLDLPNAYQGVVLYGEGDAIDSIDPTIENYKNYAIGMCENGNRLMGGTGMCLCNSSTTKVSTITTKGMLSSGYKYENVSVIPILEI